MAARCNVQYIFQTHVLKENEIQKGRLTNKPPQARYIASGNIISILVRSRQMSLLFRTCSAVTRHDTKCMATTSFTS